MNLKCPFRATIMTRSFSCDHASEITRREGPDIGCNSEELNAKCTECFTELKNRSLPELGCSDDLTEMPASVLQKVQFGGLLALQITVLQRASDTVDDISALIEASYDQYGDISNFPFEPCIESIKTYRLKRRRNR